MRLKLLFGIILILSITGCMDTSTSKKAGMPGSDRDEHGCIGSAGYSWCERTKQCERPWELSTKHGFPQTKEAFEAFCNQPGK